MSCYNWRPSQPGGFLQNIKNTQTFFITFLCCSLLFLLLLLLFMFMLFPSIIYVLTFTFVVHVLKYCVQYKYGLCLSV